MSQFQTQQTTVSSETAGLQSYIAGVFSRMGIAVLITAAVAFLFYTTNLYMFSPIAFIFIAIAEFGICIFLSSRIMTMKQSTATACLYGYAALTGVTFSVLPVAFDLPTFFTAFLFAAVMFLCCAVIGHTTNVDLSKFTGLLIGGLIAMVVATIASLFIPALRDSLIISYIGVILFLFITAWDMQKVKSYYYGTAGGQGTAGANLAVYGAFQLYLDFINIFLYINRIFGSRSSRK